MNKLTEAELLLSLSKSHVITSINNEYLSIRNNGGYKYERIKCKCCGNPNCEKGSTVVGELEETRKHIEEVADLVGLKVIRSNGIFFLYDTKNPFVPTEQEIAKFKKDNPYAIHMKTGVQKNNLGEPLRKTMMKRLLAKEFKKPNFIHFVQYLKKNHYRILKEQTVKKKMLSLKTEEKLLDALYELDLLSCQTKWKKLKIERTYKITKEGMKLV